MTLLASSQGQNEGHRLLTYYTYFKVCERVNISEAWANLTGEASIFGNALCRYFSTISKIICDTSGEDWGVDEIMWQLKIVCMSAVTRGDGNIYIA